MIESLFWLVVGVVLGMFIRRGTLWQDRGAHPPVEIHEGHAPYRKRCQFLAVHECTCVLDAGHSIKHVCIHGAQWGAYYRPSSAEMRDQQYEIEP